MPPNIEPSPNANPRPNIPPPIPSPLKQDHSLPVGEQQTVDVSNLPRNAGNNLFQPDNRVTSPEAYDFILNPETGHSSTLKPKLPQSLGAKLGIGLVALMGIILLISIASSLFSSPSNLPYFESVLEDQQEIVHIATNAQSEPDISSNNQVFVTTTIAALSSNSSALQAYLQSNGTKINSALLSLKINSAVDNELTSAESSGTFNSTFDQIARAQLNVYIEDLATARTKAGPQGRSLLTSFINQANLLLVSLANGT
ncbi:MAG TPA: hypothetical protein VFN31_03655 [Candidatus Saccharimonadales bacterium]|nr:hypothetical protein [Candidatus Saccharimonadales bacterium]